MGRSRGEKSIWSLSTVYALVEKDALIALGTRKRSEGGWIFL